MPMKSSSPLILLARSRRRFMEIFSRSDGKKERKGASFLFQTSFFIRPFLFQEGDLRGNNARRMDHVRKGWPYSFWRFLGGKNSWGNCWKVSEATWAHVWNDGIQKKGEDELTKLPRLCIVQNGNNWRQCQWCIFNPMHLLLGKERKVQENVVYMQCSDNVQKCNFPEWNIVLQKIQKQSKEEHPNQVFGVGYCSWPKNL